METIIRGREAIEYAERTGAQLCVYTSPIEEAREDLTLEEARAIAREDEGLVYVRVTGMHEYTIATDAETETLTARDIDEAARRFSGDRVKSAAELANTTKNAGGWITIREDGATVLRAGER